MISGVKEPAGWTRARALSWVARSALVGLLVAGLAVLPSGSPEATLLPLLVECVAVVVFLVRVLRMPARPTAIWVNLWLSVALFTIGDLAYAWQEDVSATAPFPGPADVWYLAAYVPQLTAVALLMRAHHARRDAPQVLDTWILCVPLAALTWVYVIAPMLAGSTTLDLAATLAIAYPVLDVAVLATLVRLAVGGGRRNRSLSLISASVTVMLLADLVFQSLDAQGMAEPVPSWLNALFTLSILLMTAAALSRDAPLVHVPSPGTNPIMSPVRALALALAALSLPILILADAGTGLAEDVKVFAAATVVIILLILVRAFGIMRTVVLQRRQLDALARTDELTRLPNRRSWDYELRRTQDWADETGRPLTLAMLDLDLFKAYNDEYGHAAGDALLRAAADAWSTYVPVGGYLARYGGEEFAMILPDCDLVQAELVLEDIRVATPAPMTVSIGCAQWGPGDNMATTLAHADAALYAAKDKGRNRVLGYPGPEPTRGAPDLSSATDTR